MSQLLKISGKSSLLKYSRQPHWTAGHGGHGEGDFKHGSLGTGLLLDVPLGTVKSRLHAAVAAFAKQFEQLTGTVKQSKDDKA